MIYGLNFNGKHIPEWFTFKPVQTFNGQKASLVGVCETRDELDMMLSQANNGKRVLSYQNKGNSFGVYIHC